MIDPPKQRTYLGRLLGLRAAEHTEREEQQVRERLRAGTSEAHVLETLRQTSDEVRNRVAAEVVEKLAAPEIVAATEHQLQRFGRGHPAAVQRRRRQGADVVLHP